MGVAGGLGRMLATPLILFNLICAIIILGLAGRDLDRTISADTGALSGFQANAATPYLITFSLIAGMVAIASYISALHHMRVWSSESGAASQAAGWIAWLLLIIAFCLAWKEIDLGGRGNKLKVLEAFVIILTFTHFFYNMVLHMGDSGDAYNNKPLPTHNSNPAAASV